MPSNGDGINTELTALPDDFIHKESMLEGIGSGNHYVVKDTRTRTRSNSVFESTGTNKIFRDQRPDMLVSKSYGSSSFLLNQDGLSPTSRLYRNQSVGDRATIQTMSNISYRGYLYKRSNHPHRNAGEWKDQQKSLYVLDSTTLPELPVIPGAFANSNVAASTDGNSNHYQQQSVLDVHSDEHNINVTPAVTPSPLNNLSTTGIQESVEPIKLHHQSTISPPRIEKKADVKNPIQLGLQLGAAFFGINLKKNEHNDNNSNDNSNSIEISHDQLGGRSDSIENAKFSEEGTFAGDGEKIKPGDLSPSMMIHSSSVEYQKEVFPSSNYIIMKTGTPKMPIPINSESSSHQDRNPSHSYVGQHRQQSATTMLSESPFSSQRSNSPSEYYAGDAGIPQDFYDPEDGHLWRAKFCVLEDGILYFYRHADVGNSAQAAAERTKSKITMLTDDHGETIDSRRSGSSANNPSFVTSKTHLGQTTSRRRSAEDLSKSPMVRPGLHPLAFNETSSSDIDTSIWEKRVFMDCVGGVRTAEQQYGHNSFELLATDDDDESDQNHIDTLILKAQNPTEMKEWIFQFHRSLAFFMRNFIDVVGSAPGRGSFSEIHNLRNMHLSSNSTHHLSSSSLSESGTITQSLSEKHLQRLISTSPSLQQTLSHGHGRIILKRRLDLKKAPSESVSLSSTPETGDMDYGHHHFAFREPSPSNFPLSQESASPPLRVLIPPPVQNFFPSTKKGNLESMGPLRINTTSSESNQRNSDLQNAIPKTSEIHRPKPSRSSGKYIPPHLRSKSKYIPPHLRGQQGQRLQGSDDTISTQSSIMKSSRNDEELKEGCSGYIPLALAERSHFTPIKAPPEPHNSQLEMKAMPDMLDMMNPSTTCFIRGGCADPQLVQGSILDPFYIPKKASRLRKTTAQAYGSFGGSFTPERKKSRSSLNWEIGAISECGVRESNEDAYIIANDLLNAFESSSYGTQPQTLWTEEETDHSVGLFGIFDGHCGDQGARFAVEQLGRFIHDELLLESIKQTNPCNEIESSSLSPIKMETVLREAMVKLDTVFCDLCQEEGREWESGATALVAMLANENLVIASLGDCRGFLCRFVDDVDSYISDDDWEQLELDSVDLDPLSSKQTSETESLQSCFWREVTTVHSPSAVEERSRIENANGWITTETEIPIGQLRRMDFHDEDVIGILKRCMRFPSQNAPFTDSERSTKECKAAPQRILHISRVCGELAVSRALGDRDFKAKFNLNCASAPQTGTEDIDTEESLSEGGASLWESPLFLPYPENHNRQFRGDLVSNTPDFHRMRLGVDGVSNEFLLLACDGLWDVMDADDAIRVVRDLLFLKKVTAKKAAARLAELAIHLGSSDNITVLLVRIFPRHDKG